MAKKTAEVVEKKTAEVVETTSVESAAKSMSVYSATGSLIRTYSKELHGDDYKEKAKGYAGKVGGTSK